MKKRLLSCLLLVCMLTALLPTEALAEEAEAISPPALEDSVWEAAPEEDPPEDEEAALPAVLSSEEAPAAEGDLFVVTTGGATNITEFSATLSMTIAGNWYPYGKHMKIYKFEYCIGDTFDERYAHDWEESYNGQDGTVDYPDGNLRYTGPVECMPGTTYTYRACFLIEDDYGYDYWEFVSDEVKTFTTPGVSGELGTLTPGNPISFDMVGGESAQFLLGGGLSGFYKLSASPSLPEGVYASSSLSIEKDGRWISVPTYEPAEPIYLDGRQRYGMVTLNGSPETRIPCTVTLSPYEVVDLPSSGTTDSFREATYFKFTPTASGKRYKLTFHITEEAESTNPYGGACSLQQWDADSQDWQYRASLSDGSAYLLSPEGNGTCYLRFSPSYQTVCAVTVSEYTPPAAISVRSGEARALNLFSASIPVMGEMPDGYDPQKLRAGIEYQVDGVTRTVNASGFYTESMWTTQSSLELFPGKEYRYRAYVEVLDDRWSVTEAILEDGWHTFTASWTEPTLLKLNQTTSCSSGEGQPEFLSFIPNESGRYTVSMEGWNRKAFWNAAQARWEWDYTSDGESKVLSMTAGDPLYIQGWLNGYSDGSITVAQFAAAVTEFSITAENPTNIQDFSARLTLIASVPIGSSFRVGVEMNGVDVPCYTIRNWEAESWNSWINLDVLPNTEYICKAYIEELDAATNRPVGSRRYGNEITFTTGDFTAVQLPVSSSVTQEASYQQQYFYFIPGTDGFYQISVTSDSPGFLQYWNAATGRWDGNGSFSGSTSVMLSAKAEIPQYFRLYPSTGEAISFQIEIAPFTSTVTDFSVKAGSAETTVPGFTASALVEAEMPIGSYCRIGLEVWQDNGYWRSFGGSWANSANGEKQAFTCTMETLPDKTYTYRAYLIPTDSNGMDLPDAAPVYGQPMQFISSSCSTDTTTALTAGTAANGTFQGGDVYFAFTPPEAGAYRIDVTGARSLTVSRPDSSGWSYYYQFDEPVIVSMENAQRYFCLSGTRNQSYSIQISRVVSSVTGFTVTAGEATAAGLEFQVPVTVTAPIGAEYSYGVEYCPLESSQWLSDGRWVEISTSETKTYQLTLPAYPGMTYTYRAYVYDRNAREYYYETATHTVQMPGLETEPVPLTEGAWTSVNVRADYSFIPAKNGNYLFTTDGLSGTLTILQEDGTWRRLNYYVNGEMAITVPLQANQHVYVIQEEYQSSVSGSVMVRATALRAVMDRSGRVAASMDAEAPGQYIFAAYSWEGKLLASGIINKTGNAAETLTSTLSSGSEAAYVKVFQLNGESCEPQVPAERSPVEYRYN